MYTPQYDDIEKTFVEKKITDLMTPSGGGESDASARLTDINSDGIAAIRPTIGTRLGSGVVTDVVGAGGMASIYKVWNERLEVFRAVKLLSRENLGARFETEAKITAKLHHKNIVEIYNVGEWNGIPYMEMELITGGDLRQVLDRYTRLPENVCCAAAITIAEALRHAHTLEFTLGGKSYVGIVHRDLKPANIMISKHGEIKLTDFGIARPTQTSLHTIEGNIVGTLHYLSPEQLEDAEIDHRSDIYSLGTILYEMVTGVKTFPQQSITELTREKSANNYKLPREYGIHPDPALVDIITKCLKHAPAKRYRNAQELLNDLKELHNSISDEEPASVLSNFFYKPGDTVRTTPANPTTRKIRARKKTGKTGMMGVAWIKGVVQIAKIPKISRTALLTITLLLFAIISLPYITAAITSSKPARAPTQERQFGIDTDTTVTDSAATAATTAENAVIPSFKTIAPTSKTVPSSTPGAKTAPVPEPKTISISEQKNTRAETTPPQFDPQKSESDLLRDAAAAMNGGEIDRAIKILEDNLYPEKNSVRTLLLLEAYVKSRRLDKAKALIDTAALNQDAHFLLSAGRYHHYRGNSAQAIASLEASLTRPSVSKSRAVIFGDAIYYIAEIKQERFDAYPSAANRSSALDGWRRVRTAYNSTPNNARYQRAEREITELQ